MAKKLIGRVNVILNAGTKREKQTGFQENLITNAYAQMVQEHADYVRQQGVDTYENINDFFKPLDAFGGILGLASAQTENVNNFMPQGIVTGYAGDNTASADIRRGTLNPSETVDITDGKRTVWDFATDEGIGTYNAVARTTVRGGNGQLFSQLFTDATQTDVVYKGASTLRVSGFNDDFSKEIQAENGTINKYEVTNDNDFKYDLVEFNSNFGSAVPLTLTGYTSYRGVTFYDGFWYVLAFKTATSANVILKLDDDFAIQQEWAIDSSGDLLIPSTSQFFSYSVGIINDFAIFCSAVTSGVSATFKIIDISSPTIGAVSTAVTSSFLAGWSDDDYTNYKTVIDPFGNENIYVNMQIGTTIVNASAIFCIIFDQTPILIEEDILNTFGRICGFVGSTEIFTPYGGSNKLTNLAFQSDTSTIRDLKTALLYYSRPMMTIFNLPSEINKTGLDTMKIVYDLLFV